MIIPALIAGAKVVGAFLASKTLAATAVKFVIGVALMRHFAKPPPTPDGNRSRNKTNVRAAVSPGRYIYGEARTGGVLAYMLQDDRDFWAVYEVSKGACDSVTGLYIDGERQEISRSADGVVTIASGKYSGHVKMWEEFAADGSTSGAGARALRSADGSKWTTDHQLDTISYIVVKLTQTVRNNEGVFSGFPELSFVVKGRKITWPGQSTPTWTENAAAVVYDYLRTRRGVPAAEIDGASFQAAFPICAEHVAVSRPDDRYSDWPATEPRYSINGIIFSDDDPERMQSEMEFAIRGNIFEWNGKFRITVGANRTPTTTITDADLAETGIESITVAPPISERVNVAVMGLEQAKRHDFQNYTAPEVADQAQIARDGERLEKNLGTRVLVNSEAALDRLLVGNLRRARSSMSITLRLHPGRLLKWLALRPTEVVSLTNKVHGLSNWKGEVSAVTLNDDMSVTAVLDEVADGEFDDDLGLGALPGRAVVAPRVNAVPEQIAQADISAVARPRAGGGGTILWKVTVTVPASFLGFIAEVTMDGITLTDYTTGNTLEFDIDAYREAMTVKVWRTSKRGLAGPTTTKTITPEYTSLVLPRPSLAKTWVQTGNDLLTTLRDPNTPVVKGAEFRYTFEPLTNADGTPNTAIPGSITAATWTAANLLDAQTLLFKPNSDGLFNLKFTVSGKYRVHARFVDAVGRYGPVGDLGYITIVVPENPSHIIGGAPSWTGTLNHMHKFTLGDDTPLLSIPAGAPNTVTADQWDGKTGASFWPFGPVEGEDAAFDASASTYYETSVLDLGQNKSGYFDADFEVYTPVEEAGGASGFADDGVAPAEIAAAPGYLPAFTGPAMENQSWNSHAEIDPVFTPIADVPKGFLTYAVDGLPNSVEFGGGRLTGAPTVGPGISGIARISAVAESGAADHAYFAWRVTGTLRWRTPGDGAFDDPHILEGQGSLDVRDLLRDGAGDGQDISIATFFEVTIPANTTLEFTLTSPADQDFDMTHAAVFYDSGARSETITLANPTNRKVTEKIGIYRYAEETDLSAINRSVEGGMSTPVRVTLAPPMPSGADLFDQWQAQQAGAGAQTVTGEFVADMAVFSAPSVGAGETPTFTEHSISAGDQVAVSSVRYLKGRIHIKKARNRALKAVTFTFLES